MRIKIFVLLRIIEIRLLQNCPGAKPIIAFGTILPILIMSWSAAFASGVFKLFRAYRNRGTCRSFCGAAANCLGRIIWCDVELVWLAYWYVFKVHTLLKSDNILV